MNKVIKVPLQTYVRTLIIVAAYAAGFSLLAFFFIPEFKLSMILLISVLFYGFKLINYMAISFQMTDKMLVYNRFFKKNIAIPYRDIVEIDIEGPSQFNSNYRLTFYGKGNSSYLTRKVLGRIPIYWYSRTEVIDLLNTIKKKKPAIEYHKLVGLYLSGEDRKRLLVNYLIQNVILIVILIIIIMKYN